MTDILNDYNNSNNNGRTPSSSTSAAAFGRRRPAGSGTANHLTTAADLIMAADDTYAAASFPYFDGSSSSASGAPLLPSSGEPTFSSSRLLDRANSIRAINAPSSYNNNVSGHINGGYHGALPTTGSSSDSAASLPSPTSPMQSNTASSSSSSTATGSYAAMYQAGKQRRSAATPTVTSSVASSNDKVLVSSVTSSTSSAIGNANNNNNNTSNNNGNNAANSSAHNADYDDQHDTDAAPDDGHINDGNHGHDDNDTVPASSRPHHRIAVSYANDDDTIITPMPSFPLLSHQSSSIGMTRETSNTTDDDGDGAYAADFEDFDDAKLLGVAPLAAIGSLPPASPEVSSHSLATHKSNNNHSNNSNNSNGSVPRPQTDRNTMHKALLNLKSKSKSKGNLSRANSAQPARRGDHNGSNDYGIQSPMYANDSPKASKNMMMNDDYDTNPSTTMMMNGTDDANDDMHNDHTNLVAARTSSASASSSATTPTASAAPRRRIVKKVRPTMADLTAPTSAYGNNSDNTNYLTATSSSSSPYDIGPNVGPSGAQSVPPSPAAKPISGPIVNTHNGFGGSRLMEEDEDMPMTDAERARIRLERLADRDMTERNVPSTNNSTSATSAATSSSSASSGARLRPPRFDLSDATSPTSTTPLADQSSNASNSSSGGGIIKRGNSPQPRGRVRFAAEDRIAAASATAAARSPSRGSPSPNQRAISPIHSNGYGLTSVTNTPIRSISLPQSTGASPMDARDRALADQPSSARMESSSSSRTSGTTSRRQASGTNGTAPPGGPSIPLNHDDVPVGPQRRRKSAHPVLIHEQASAAAAAAAVLGNNNNNSYDVPASGPSMISSVSQPSARRGRRSSIPNNITSNDTVAPSSSSTSSTYGTYSNASHDYDDEDRQAEPLSSGNMAATAMTPKHGVHLSAAPSPVPRSSTRSLRTKDTPTASSTNSDNDISYRLDRAAELAAFGGRESRGIASATPTNGNNGNGNGNGNGALTGRRAVTASTTPKDASAGFANSDDIPVGPRRGNRAGTAAAAVAAFDSKNDGIEPMQLPQSASAPNGRRASVAPPIDYGDDDTTTAAGSYAEIHQSKMQQTRKIARKKVVGDVVKGGGDAISPLPSPTQQHHHIQPQQQGEYKTSSLFTNSGTSASSSTSVGSVSSTAHVGSTTVIPDRRPGTTKKTLRHPQLSDEDNGNGYGNGPPMLNTNLDSPPQGYGGGNIPYRSPTADRNGNYGGRVGGTLDPSSAYRGNGALSAGDAMELESMPSSSLPPSPKPHGLHPSAYQLSSGGSAAHARLVHGHHHSISEPLSPPQSGPSAMISSSSNSLPPSSGGVNGMPPPHRRIRRPATVNGDGITANTPMTPSSASSASSYGVPPLRGGVPSPSSASGERALGAAARGINPYANIPSTPGGTSLSSTPTNGGASEPRTPGNRARITAGRRVSVSQTSSNGMDTGRSDVTAPSPSSASSGGGIPADYKGNDADYIPSSQLKPCRAPKEELKQAFTAIKSTDWSVRFAGINTLRQLAVHHTDYLLPHVRACVRDLRPEVDSLRSSLAKNSMMCLCDLFQQCKRGMDNELVAIVPSLLRRAGEAQGFLAEEGCRALEEMIRTVTESKSLAILITHASNGNKVIKQMAAVFLDKAIELLGSRVVQSKEYSSLIKTIGVTFSGASAPVRVAARNSVLRLAKLVGVIELETTMKRALTAQQFNPIKKVLDQGVNQDLNLGGPAVARVRATTAKRGVVRRFAGATGAAAAAAAASPMDDEAELAVGGLPSYSYGIPPSSSSATTGDDDDDDNDIGAASADFADVQSFPPRSHIDARATQSSYSDPGSSLSVRSTTSYKSGLGSLRAAAGRNMFEKKVPARTGEEVEQLSAVFSEMTATDFRQRANGITRLLAFVDCYNETANDQVGRLFDQFLPRLADSNSKVQLASLAALEKLVPALKDNMTTVVQLLVPALAANLASSNAAVKKATQETMSLIMMSLDETVLLQSFATAVTFGNARVKPLMIEKLDELCVRVYRSKPNLVTRHVIPVAFSLIDDTKPDIRIANRRLLQRLHSLMGDSLMDPTLTAKLSAASITKVRALLSSSDL